MFRAELELTDFMDTKSVTGYKLCKWLTITVRGNGMTHSSFLTSNIIQSSIWRWPDTGYSLAELFLQLIVVRELGARLLRHADTGLAILSQASVALLHFRCYFRYTTWEVVCAELLSDGHRYFVPKISSVSNLNWSSLVSQNCLIQ